MPLCWMFPVLPRRIVIDIDLLDGKVGERDAEAQGAGPPVPGEHGQGHAIYDDHQDLRHEDGLAEAAATSDGGGGDSWHGTTGAL